MDDKFYITDSDIPQSYYDFVTINRATDSNDPYELEKLSHHTSEMVRARVAENQNTPVVVLERLKKDTKFVALYLVRNRNLPFHLLREYMDINDEALKKRVYERMLKGYQDGALDLTGEEVYKLILFLEPQLDNLTRIELIEEFHVRYDRAKGKL